MTAASPASDIRSLCEGLGFALVGFAPVAPTAHSQYIKDWLDADKHGQMHYLENHLPVRLNPSELLDSATSIICVADQYPATAEQAENDNAEPVGRIARYAWGDDYHKVMKKRLFEVADSLRTKYPEAQFKCVVDTAPLLEREHAQRAGLGWVGKHTLLIHPTRGSWLLLGAIVTTLKVEPDEQQQFITDHCGTCTRCIDACPTDCIEPYQLDASRCISYLTIEHRDVIDETLQSQMGDWLAGCDICQEVCPHNREVDPLQIHERYQPRDLSAGLKLIDILNWEAEDRQRVFQGSALKRIKLDMLKRNALIAAGNQLKAREDAALLEKIQSMAEDDSLEPLVQQTAKHVLRSHSSA